MTLTALTLAEAKKHFVAHTKACLSNDAIRAAKRSTRWHSYDNGVSYVTLAGDYVLAFLRNEQGFIYAKQVVVGDLKALN